MTPIAIYNAQNEDTGKTGQIIFVILATIYVFSVKPVAHLLVMNVVVSLFYGEKISHA